MNIFQWIQSKFGGVGIYAAIYIAAWVLNATCGTKFDLPQLLELVKWMVANHLINSGLNTAVPVVGQIKGGNKHE